jgi:prophage regulatory protein
VPLGDTTIYELEQRGAFPRRFNLTPRCVVWDLAEVEAWVEIGEGILRPD